MSYFLGFNFSGARLAWRPDCSRTTQEGLGRNWELVTFTKFQLFNCWVVTIR